MANKFAEAVMKQLPPELAGPIIKDAIKDLRSEGAVKDDPRYQIAVSAMENLPPKYAKEIVQSAVDSLGFESLLRKLQNAWDTRREYLPEPKSVSSEPKFPCMCSCMTCTREDYCCSRCDAERRRGYDLRPIEPAAKTEEEAREEALADDEACDGHCGCCDLCIEDQHTRKSKQQWRNRRSKY